MDTVRPAGFREPLRQADIDAIVRTFSAVGAVHVRGAMVIGVDRHPEPTNSLDGWNYTKPKPFRLFSI